MFPVFLRRNYAYSWHVKILRTETVWTVWLRSNLCDISVLFKQYLKALCYEYDFDPSIMNLVVFVLSSSILLNALLQLTKLGLLSELRKGPIAVVICAPSKSDKIHLVFKWATLSKNCSKVQWDTVKQQPHSWACGYLAGETNLVVYLPGCSH